MLSNGLLSVAACSLLVGPRNYLITLNFCPTQDFDRSRKPSKKHRKSRCHKSRFRTLKQRPRGFQNGVQMVPKPPKNEIQILTRKATSKKTSKYQIRTLFGMFGTYPGPPKNILFHHFLETKTSPGASPEGTGKTACKKVTPFSKKDTKSDPGGTQDGSQNPSKITLWSIGDPPAAALADLGWTPDLPGSIFTPIETSEAAKSNHKETSEPKLGSNLHTEIHNNYIRPDAIPMLPECNPCAAKCNSKCSQMQPLYRQMKFLWSQMGPSCRQMQRLCNQLNEIRP